MDALTLTAASAVISAAIGYLVSWYRTRAQPFVSLQSVSVMIHADEPFALAEVGGSRRQTSDLDFEALSALTSEAWILPPTDFARTTAGEVEELLASCAMWESYGGYLDESVRIWIDRLKSAPDDKAVEGVLFESLNEDQFSYLLAEASLRGRLKIAPREEPEELRIDVMFSSAARGGCYVFDFDDALVLLGAGLDDNPFADVRLSPLVQTFAELDRDEIIKIFEQVPSLFWHQQNLVTRFRELIEDAFDERRRWLVHLSIANLGKPMLVHTEATLTIDGGGIERTSVPCVIWDAVKGESGFEYRPSGGEAVLLSEGEIIHLAAVTIPYREIQNVQTMRAAFEAAAGPGSTQAKLNLNVRGPERLRPRRTTSGAINFTSLASW